MNPGDTVRWWTKDGGWRFGHLASINGSKARVTLGDTVKRVPTADLRTWPPERAAHDTTPPQRRAKRKGRG